MPPLKSAPRGSTAKRARIAGATDTNRRDALKLLASGLAFSLASCSRPREEIVPYVDMPERMVAGEPEQYATALPLAGYARGVIVDSVDGRPIKVSGNPRHPASLGATDIFAEAEILSLYDPDRSGTVRGPDPVSTWGAFLTALEPRLSGLDGTDGAGLRLVSGRITSPTLKRQIADLANRFPQMRRHAYEPAEGDLAGREGLAIGWPALDEADVIVTLDADPLGAGPDQIVNARRFAARRKPSAEGVSRLYALESTRTLTGANADHRLALAPAAIETFANGLAARLGGDDAKTDTLPDEAKRLLDAIAAEADENKRVLVLAGDTLSARARQAVEGVNREGADDGQPPRSGGEMPPPAPLDELWEALENDQITDLIVLGCNPVHDFPDPKIAESIRRVAFSAHAGFDENETSAACQWHLPQTHWLEAWTDLAARDGTVSIVQPLIRPLYETRSTHEILAMLAGNASPDGHEIVRTTWRTNRSDEAFESWWRDTLLEGVVERKRAAGDATANPSSGSTQTGEESTRASSGGGELVAVIRPDPSIYDQRYSNNAWLQECPKPIGKHTWLNVIALAPRDADRLGVKNGDVVSVRSSEGEIAGPVHVDKGHAAGVVGLTLGYGRTVGGKIGTGIGYNARALSPRRITALVNEVELAATGESRHVPTTQDHFTLEGGFADLMPLVTAESDFEIEEKRKKAGESFLHPERESDGYEWAMVIDNAACIGCNACVVACQSENNIAVVGPDEVANSRIMHWLRIDRYEREEGPTSVGGFEPVPCMQCQKAPCEPVCPVEASIHDTEGLNDQVYNRCVGTRFCQSNCPYKVRRFNWFAYGSGQEYENLGEEPMPAHYNPDVTVRARGVMEKCTYCVQRISRARHQAINTDEPIRDGDVQTACQQACPTQAISFGNIADKAARVTTLQDDPRHFTLLEELGTEPRTTYLARIRNVSPKLAEEPS